MRDFLLWKKLPYPDCISSPFWVRRVVSKIDGKSQRMQNRSNKSSCHYHWTFYTVWSRYCQIFRYRFVYSHNLVNRMKHERAQIKPLRQSVMESCLPYWVKPHGTSLASYFIHVQAGLWATIAQELCTFVIPTLKAESKQCANLKYVPVDSKLPNIYYS